MIFVCPSKSEINDQLGMIKKPQTRTSKKKKKKNFGTLYINEFLPQVSFSINRYDRIYFNFSFSFRRPPRPVPFLATATI